MKDGNYSRTSMADNGPQTRSSLRWQAIADQGPQAVAQGFLQTKNGAGGSKLGQRRDASPMMSGPIQLQGMEVDDPRKIKSFDSRHPALQRRATGTGNMNEH